MIKNIFSSFWFWGILLVAFIAIILWDDSFEENAKGTYVKHQMSLDNVNFSQIENGFEHARMYATNCVMDDNQTNMEAKEIKVLFFKEDVATYTGKLIAASATKSPFEAKLFGDVKFWDTDNLRMRTEEMRYLFNRKELTTQRPITVWKDNAVLTGLGMTYKTETKEIRINQQVVIRLWEEKKEEPKPMTDKDPISGLPIATNIEGILAKVNATNTSTLGSNTSDIKSYVSNITSKINNSFNSQKLEDIMSFTSDLKKKLFFESLFSTIFRWKENPLSFLFNCNSNNASKTETKLSNQNFEVSNSSGPLNLVNDIASKTIKPLIENKSLKTNYASETKNLLKDIASNTENILKNKKQTNLIFQESYR